MKRSFFTRLPQPQDDNEPEVIEYHQDTHNIVFQELSSPTSEDRQPGVLTLKNISEGTSD